MGIMRGMAHQSYREQISSRVDRSSRLSPMKPRDLLGAILSEATIDPGEQLFGETLTESDAEVSSPDSAIEQDVLLEIAEALEALAARVDGEQLQERFLGRIREVNPRVVISKFAPRAESLRRLLTQMKTMMEADLPAQARQTAPAPTASQLRTMAAAAAGVTLNADGEPVGANGRKLTGAALRGAERKIQAAMATVTPQPAAPTHGIRARRNTAAAATTDSHAPKSMFTLSFIGRDARIQMVVDKLGDIIAHLNSLESMLRSAADGRSFESKFVVQFYESLLAFKESWRAFEDDYTEIASHAGGQMLGAALTHLDMIWQLAEDLYVQSNLDKTFVGGIPNKLRRLARALGFNQPSVNVASTPLLPTGPG